MAESVQCQAGDARRRKHTCEIGLKIRADSVDLSGSPNIDGPWLQECKCATSSAQAKHSVRLRFRATTTNPVALQQRAKVRLQEWIASRIEAK
jgi:hypothetical protein